MNTDISTLILFVISTIGMTHIIVDGSIMEWFRKLVKWSADKLKAPKLGGVVDCYLCAGTWCGFAMGWTLISQNIFVILACGFAGAFLANLGAVFLNLLEAMTIVNLPDKDDD